MASLKKKVALALTLTMALTTMTVSVFAVGEEDGQAGIEFEAGVFEIIDPPSPTDPTDPGNPGTPTDPDNWKISDRTIDFGEQTVSTKQEEYNSVTDGAAGQKYIGLKVSNGTEVNYVVSVAIAGFDADTELTMEGFDLELTPAAAITNGSTTPTAETVNISAGALGVQGTKAPIFTVGKGQSGCNWSGDLTVQANTATPGTHTAVMEWSFAPVVAP